MIYHITFIKLSLKSKMGSLHIIPKVVSNPKNKKKLHDLDSVFNYIKDLIYVYNGKQRVLNSFTSFSSIHSYLFKSPHT